MTEVRPYSTIILVLLDFYSIRKGRVDVQKLSYNYSARTKRSDERCLVDEDGGYRIFGGCLPADQKKRSQP
ncbi:hypothetical protein BA81_18742 [Bacillus safensis FO-36b]|nr:hypothetical protein BA81_18742 [Bacillus safensis FO-36b]